MSELSSSEGIAHDGASAPLLGRDGAFAEPGTDGGEPPRRSHRGRVLAAAAVALAGLAVAAVVLLQSAGSGRPRAGGVVPAGETTTTVARRTLVESSTVDGTLGYGSALEIYDRLAGTFTWLPGVGAVIGRGGTLFRVDNVPVALMYGGVPAYRTMKIGVGDGPDIAELNANLVALGFDPYGAIVADEHFSEATAAAVRRWQHAEGVTETGQVELGRVVFAPSARRVSAVKVALGQDPPEGTNPTESTPAPAPAPAPHGGSEPKSPSKAPARAHHPSSKPRAKSKPHAPASDAGHEVPAKGKPAASESPSQHPGRESSNGGGGAGAGQLALSTTAASQVVHLQVKAEQQQLAHVGEHAPVTLPGGSVVGGRITDVGTVATEGKENEGGGGGGGGGGGNGNGNGNGNGSGSSTISVTVALDHAVAHLDAAPVSVELVKNIARNVLAVPATALVAVAGGGYAIEGMQNGRTVEVPVTPGMFANGYVQIEGAGVSEGMTVTESQ